MVELLVVISIMAIISTVVVVRFSAYDSTVLLKSLAYEVGISLREAQAYSLSALGNNTGGPSSFESAYGLSFTPDAKEYYFFQYMDESVRPHYNAGSSAVVVLDTYHIGRSLRIKDVCVVTYSSAPNCQSVPRLDISFRRPEFDALFFVEGWSEIQNKNIINGRVALYSPSAEDVWTVSVSLLGQITIDKQ